MSRGRSTAPRAGVRLASAEGRSIPRILSRCRCRTGTRTHHGAAFDVWRPACRSQESWPGDDTHYDVGSFRRLQELAVKHVGSRARLPAGPSPKATKTPDLSEPTSECNGWSTMTSVRSGVCRSFR